ncbi:zinc finger protein [Saccharopolyspora sp. 5N708]|uniref:zinc finger protein n=1 Tax=Saccharopolyspora sp. 5N708 TaxID=3457424 RepID=UPI003FD2B258
MGEYLTYIWRPVTGGRHAFPVAARKVPSGELVRAFCGAEADAGELHDRTELDWIREDSCMRCWHLLAAPSDRGEGHP